MWSSLNRFSLAMVFIIFGNYICHAIVCYKCDSLTLEACAMSLDETGLPFEECPTALDCVMSIVDSVTYRGCGPTTPSVGATYKKNCRTNLCNKGVYPPGRLKCFHCNDATCMEKPKGKPRPCLSHHEHDECYTEVVDVSYANRGCRSDANRTLTEIQVEYCDINGCNNRPGLNKLKCAQCDSRTERGCKMDLSTINLPNCNITQYQTCEVDVPLTSSATCFLYHHLDRVVRGCTLHIPSDIAADIEHRTECNNTELCNASCLPQQKCVVCDSSKYGKCRDDTSMISKSTCSSAEISSCYACEYKNWHVIRDCGPPPTVDGNRCFECDTDECGKPLTRCYKCSTINNANCANWERPNYNIEIEECQKPGAPCITAAFANNVIRRGCENSDLHCNATLPTCHQCNGSFCNKGRYPPQRLRCYQCVGSEACKQIDADPLPCPGSTLDYGDACFEYFDIENGGMVRGCRSNALLYYRCIFHNGGIGCRTCHEDGCNNNAATSVSEIACYRCINCPEEQHEATNLELCANTVPFGYNESCYVTLHLDGTTSRGCSFDKDRQINTWDVTKYCSMDGCNFEATSRSSKAMQLTESAVENFSQSRSKS